MMENMLLNIQDLDRIVTDSGDLKNDRNGLNGRRMDLFSISAYLPESETESIPESLFFGSDLDRLTQGLEEFAGVRLPDARSQMSALDQVKQMYSGTVLENGKQSLGLKAIHDWKINENYRESNIRQHAGYAAEVISTARENSHASATGSEIFTCRADDLPELYDFRKNDPYVDKVRMDADGRIIEKIQTKFIGRDGKSCADKLLSSRCAKYIEDGMVDKIEIPKDYFDGAKQRIQEKIGKWEQQLQRTSDLGKTEAAEKIQRRLERAKKLDTMLESSSVTMDDAIFSTKHPTIYAAANFSKDSVSSLLRSLDDQWDSVKVDVAKTALITGGVSFCSNISEVMNGEKEFADAVLDSGKEIALASGTQLAVGLIDNNVSVLMEHSSSQLFRTLGRCGIPSAVISTAATSLDSLVDLAHGEIDYLEFVDDLAENGIRSVGGALGYTAVIGAVAGMNLPAIGTAGLAIAGSMAASVVAGQVYLTCRDVLPEAAEACGKAMQDLGNQTVRYVSETIPQAVGEIQNGLNEFFGSLNLNFTV